MAQGKMMWMGTRASMGWVPAPIVQGYDNSPVGWSSKQDFLNGGTRIRRSQATHREYDFTWNLISREDSRKIQDLYSGIRGDGPIYFLDPFAMDTNLVPAHWAAPMLGAADAPSLMLDYKPTLMDSEVNTLGYPVKAAVYNNFQIARRKLFIPIPPGYTLWAGVHGPAVGGSLTASPVLTSGNVTSGPTMTTQSVNSNVRFSRSYDGDTYSGVEFAPNGNSTYSGFMVQVLPTGATPATGGFISGQGHSGTDFVSTPHQEPYSAVKDMVGVNIKLAEVYDWL